MRTTCSAGAAGGSGSGRERLVHAVASRHGADPFAGRHREARQLPRVDATFIPFRIFPFFTRHCPAGAFRARLTSVHAFASDPKRGTFILVFLGVVVGGSLLIYALRAPKVAGGKPFRMLSRETLLLINNLLFTCAAAMVLLGTLYPLIGDALGVGRISVGPPYFGFMFVLLMLPAVLLMPLGPFFRWAMADWRATFRALRPALAIAIVAAIAAKLLTHDLPLRGVAGVAGALWVGIGIVLYDESTAGARRRAENVTRRKCWE